MSPLLSNILTNTYTKSEALHRLHELKDVLVAKFFKTTALERVEDGSESFWISKLSPNVLESFNRKNVYELFVKLEQEVRAMDPVVFYLPFDLPKESLAQIGKKLRTLYGKDLLMEIKIDPSILAGCCLSYNGVYKDYSLRQKIESNKNKILEMMRGETKI